MLLINLLSYVKDVVFFKVRVIIYKKIKDLIIKWKKTSIFKAKHTFTQFLISLLNFSKHLSLFVILRPSPSPKVILTNFCVKQIFFQYWETRHLCLVFKTPWSVHIRSMGHRMCTLAMLNKVNQQRVLLTLSFESCLIVSPTLSNIGDVLLMFWKR